MWISQGTWLNQLLWNDFRIIYGDKYHLRFRYQALVQSKQLGVFGLDDYRRVLPSFTSVMGLEDFLSSQIVVTGRTDK